MQNSVSNQLKSSRFINMCVANLVLTPLCVFDDSFDLCKESSVIRQ